MAWRDRLPEQHIHLGRTASRIEDPVLRLQFLRAAAPLPLPARRRALRRRWILCAALLPLPLVPFWMDRPAVKNQPPYPHPALPQSVAVRPAAEPVAVWQIEQTANSEIYSNGLRVDTRFAILNHPRSYAAFPRRPGASTHPNWRSQPAGIVFHTTESCQAPFEPQDTPIIKRLGEELLEYVRRNRAYHYLIDRFGRVYRVVAESDTAYHAGHSVWADDDWFYLDLNSSFLGVSFEAHSQSGSARELISPAQIRAAAMLTEMLRNRYQIPAANCVTHAQVSVNPSNMLIGYHTDWATGFPFAAVGLPDNYGRPLPSLWAFGFGYEPVWLDSGRPVSSGVAAAELQILRGSAAAGLRPEAYRKNLQKRYRQWVSEAGLNPGRVPPDGTRSPASPAAPDPPFQAAHKRTRPLEPAER